MSVEELEQRVAAIEARLGIFGEVPLPDYAGAIVRAVANYFNVTPSELRSGREQTRTWPRRVAAYVLHKNANLSNRGIARQLRWKEHSTSCAAIHAVRDTMTVDREARQQVEYLVAITKREATNGAGEVEQNTAN